MNASPSTSRTGPRNLITDVAGLRVGQAEDARARTGVMRFSARSAPSSSWL